MDRASPLYVHFMHFVQKSHEEVYVAPPPSLIQMSALCP
jgi:hypothetical protein